MESRDRGSLSYGKLLLAGDDLEANLASPLSNILLRAGQQGRKGGFQKLPQARGDLNFGIQKFQT
jgi:hypothetical protein